MLLRRLLRILTNLNIDRGRKIQRSPDLQPLEEGDYFLANKVAEAQGEQSLETDKVVEQLSQDSIVNASRGIRPSVTATYVRPAEWSLNCSCRPALASADLANTSRPDASRSSRWTTNSRPGPCRRTCSTSKA